MKCVGLVSTKRNLCLAFLCSFCHFILGVLVSIHNFLNVSIKLERFVSNQS